MVGTPCATIYSTIPIVYILLDATTQNSQPTTVIMNTTTSVAASDYLGIFYKKFFNSVLDLSPNTTYVWQVKMTNGKEWASSEIFTFTTRTRDCSMIPCVEGKCYEDTLVCSCNFGWSGPDCSVGPKKSGYKKFYFLHSLFPDSTTTIVIACCVAGGALMLGVVALGAIFVAWKKKAHDRVKLFMPDFASIMFTPGLE